MVLIWVCVTLLDLPNFKFIGWGGHAFSPLILHCSFRLDNVWWFNTILYTGLALCVPMWVILFCYVQIWRAATTSLYSIIWKIEQLYFSSIAIATRTKPCSRCQRIFIAQCVETCPGRGYRLCSFMTQTVFERTQGVWCVQTYTGEEFFSTSNINAPSTYGRAKVCPIDEPKTAP